MKKSKIKKSIKLPTHVKVYIQEDGTILIYDLLDDFIDIAYKINPDEKRINYLHHKQTKKRVKKVKDNLKIKKGGKGE
jgi:hypothetical protein